MPTLLKLYFTLGLFGAHRLYTCEPYIALLYLCTLGLWGVGAVTDLFQLAYLLDRAQHSTAYEKYSLFTAYQLLVPPFGLLGFHHFYLGNGQRGWWYAATGGMLGVGVLHDVLTLPTQVREANEAHVAQQVGEEEVRAQSALDSPTDRDLSSAPFPRPVRTGGSSSSSSFSASYRGARAALSAAVYGSASSSPPRCIACMVADINTVFLDCGHSVFCIECAKTFVEFARDNAGDGGGEATRGGGPTVFSTITSTTLPTSASTPSLPCPICRREAREIKQIRWG